MAHVISLDCHWRQALCKFTMLGMYWRCLSGETCRAHVVVHMQKPHPLLYLALCASIGVLELPRSQVELPVTVTVDQEVQGPISQASSPRRDFAVGDKSTHGQDLQGPYTESIFAHCFSCCQRAAGSSKDVCRARRGGRDLPLRRALPLMPAFFPLARHCS